MTIGVACNDPPKWSPYANSFITMAHRKSLMTVSHSAV
jgi:hypothetical protein